LGNDEQPTDLSAREPAKNPEKNETPSGEPTSEAFQIAQIPPARTTTGENSAAFSPRYAGFMRRAVAMGIDCVIIATFVYLTWRAALDFAGDAGLILYLYLACYSLAFPFAYFVYFHAVGGQTPGKMALGVRVVAQTAPGRKQNWRRRRRDRRLPAEPRVLQVCPISEPNLRKNLRAWNFPAFLRIECGIGPAPAGAHHEKDFRFPQPSGSPARRHLH
jgi:hypothetical protein